MEATPADLAALPRDLRENMKLVAASTSYMRQSYDASGPSANQKGGPSLMRLESGTGPEANVPPLLFDAALTEPDYPDQDWVGQFEDPIITTARITYCLFADDDDPVCANNQTARDRCANPGYLYPSRVEQLNTTLLFETIKDVAEQACAQSYVGFSADLICIITDLLYFVQKIFDENQELCNDALTAAEVSATWSGLKVVHGNVQNVYESLNMHDVDVDAQLTLHDTDIKALLVESLGKQDAMLEDLATIIELLNTPSGRRSDWQENP